MNLGRSEGTFEDPRLGRWAYEFTWALVGGGARPVEECLRSLDDPPRAASRRVRQAVEDFDRARRERTQQKARGYAGRAAMAARAAAREGSRQDTGRYARRAAFVARAAGQQGQYKADAPRRGGRYPLSDELLVQVALVYRTALREGGNPRQAVANAFGVSESTASKYIRRARDKGFLGETTPGKAGEEEQED